MKLILEIIVNFFSNILSKYGLFYFIDFGSGLALNSLGSGSNVLRLGQILDCQILSRIRVEFLIDLKNKFHVQTRNFIKKVYNFNPRQDELLPISYNIEKHILNLSSMTRNTLF